MSQYIHLNKETKAEVQKIASVLNSVNDDRTMIEDLHSPALLDKCLKLSKSTIRSVFTAFIMLFLFVFEFCFCVFVCFRELRKANNELFLLRTVKDEKFQLQIKYEQKEEFSVCILSFSFQEWLVYFIFVL